jgi:hypothetical protein
MSDQTIPSPTGPSGAVILQRAMIMSGDFLERLSQLVKGKMGTATALLAAARSTIIEAGVFAFMVGLHGKGALHCVAA